MNNESLPVKLILASSSKYRQLLLRRLGIPFEAIAPETDETARANESPADLVARLAFAKADAICQRFPACVVIGSDQVAVFDGKVLGKPGAHAAAFKQLESFSGQSVDFLTSVVARCHDSDFTEQYTDRTTVHFRSLSSGEIERYLVTEKPYDCAGAFKAESLGVTLFESIENNDPTALIGLPLIHVAAMLRRAGIRLP
jgi:septum formation protein